MIRSVKDIDPDILNLLKDTTCNNSHSSNQFVEWHGLAAPNVFHFGYLAESGQLHGDWDHRITLRCVVFPRSARRTVVCESGARSARACFGSPGRCNTDGSRGWKQDAATIRFAFWDRATRSTFDTPNRLPFHTIPLLRVTSDES
jgi:hypothetical protein